MSIALIDSVAPPQHVPLPADAMRISPALVNRAIYVTGGLTSLLALIGLVGTWSAPQQNAFSYLTAYVFAVSIAIGALFWVMIHHLTSAGWSVVVRRLFENLTLCMPVLTLLFVPIALSLSSIYGWMDAEANASDPLWQAKRGYLNAFWFIVRAAVFLLCWTGLAWRMRSWSVRQDQSGDSPPHPQPLSPGGARGDCLTPPAPAHLHRLQPVFAAFAQIEKSRAGRGEQPLMAIGAIEVGGDVVEIERDHRRRMGAIDDGEDAAPPGLGTQRFRRQHQAGRRKDVAEEE
jgi:hypothetical protein